MRAFLLLVFLAGCDIAGGLAGGKGSDRELALERKIASLERQLAARDAAEVVHKDALETCLLDAEGAYWRYIKLNGWRKRGTKAEDGIWQAPMIVWNQAAADKRNAIEECKATRGR